MIGGWSGWPGFDVNAMASTVAGAEGDVGTGLFGYTCSPRGNFFSVNVAVVFGVGSDDERR